MIIFLLKFLVLNKFIFFNKERKFLNQNMIKVYQILFFLFFTNTLYIYIYI